MRIALTLNGPKQHRVNYWQTVIEHNGLADVTDCVRQINPVHGRNRDNIDNFPEDWDGRDLTGVGHAMHDKVERVSRQWMPKQIRFQFIDYEPRRYNPDGTIRERWMLNKLRNGYDDSDTRFLTVMSEGVRTFDNTPLSFYSTPRLPKEPMDEQAVKTNESARKICADSDWLWLNAYATGDNDKDWLDDHNVGRHSDRIISQADALSVHRKPIVPTIFPSYSFLKASDSRQFNAPTIGIIEQAAKYNPLITHLGIWVDLNHELPATRQALNTLCLLDMLKRITGV